MFYYWHLALARIVLVCVPQGGYIHPDEYFQSIEVLAGKFLDVEHQPPWEFNTTFPIRSIALPYFTIGLSYKFLKIINDFTLMYNATSVITPYFVVVVPRLLMCLFSFIVDFSVYKMCINNNEKYKGRLLVLSSSYVILTYGTRTLSNTFELVLFALLLYYVCDSLTFSNILTKRRDYINYRYDQSKTAVEKAKFHKLKLFLVSDSLRNCFYISTISVFGFFNRPTFLAYAVFPIFFWLYRGIGSKSVTALNFHIRIFILALCSIPSFLLIIFIDSLYYGYISWGEIGMMEVSINSFVFTPLNFFKYNVDTSNLALHGIHPKFLHALVNIPLLFNVLGFFGFYSISQYIYLCVMQKYNMLPTVRSIKGLMTLSVIAPVGLLSLFPHQEPRFIIPILVPFVYLYGNSIYSESDNVLIEATKQTNNKSDNLKPNTQKSNFLFKLWLVLNTIFLLFYGFLHQGGMFPASAYLSQQLKETSAATEFHILSSHTYSIPRCLFLQRPSDKLYSLNDKKYSINKRVFLYEEGSKDLEYVIKKINTILATNEKRLQVNRKKKYKIFVLVPSSLAEHFNFLADKEYFFLKLIRSFYPHVTAEAFPDLSKYCLDATTLFISNCEYILSFKDYLAKLGSLFALNLYEINYTNI